MSRWQPFALSYSLTRPFPRPRLVFFAVTACGVVLATLFTFVSVATTAYQFQSLYSSDPNGTVADHKWFQKAPFTWLDSMETACQDTVLVAGGRYMTMNQGFIYTLDAASTNGKPLAQFSYHNSTLENCEVAEIAIYLKRAAITKSSGMAWSWGNTVASAIVSCSIGNTAGTTAANFTVQLPIVSERKHITISYLTQNGTGHQSMWYGARLTSEWYRQVAMAMALSSPPAWLGDSWADGAIKLHRNPHVTDYRSLDFFYVDYQQPVQSGGLAFQPDENLTASDWLHGTYGLPNTTITVDTFGKAFYSLVALEFGIASKANALLTSDGANYLASQNDKVALKASQRCYAEESLFYCRAGKIDLPVDKAVDFNTTRETTLYAQYLCSVPREKNGFVVFYTVLLANIVFLRACWSLFSVIASSLIEQQDRSANYCEGCVAAKSDGISMLSRSASTTSLIHEGQTSRNAGHDDDRLTNVAMQPLLDGVAARQMEQMRQDSSPPRGLGN